MKKIYLDYNATTPILPEIFEAMKPYLTEKWGNPSSAHYAGKNLYNDIEKARASIAETLKCKKDEIFFTSCGTESDNWALKTAIYSSTKKNKHIITTVVEHPAVIETCKFLEKNGVEVTYIPVDENGNISLELLENSIKEETVLVSTMLANNETGVLFPIKEIREIAKKHNILFHVDAVQGYGKIPFDFFNMNIDFLSVSGHKVYAPKGIGVLVIKEGAPIEPLIHGGGQENGLRSGTENVASIVALGKAAEIIKNDMSTGYRKTVENMRNFLEKRLLEELSPVEINGFKAKRICNTCSISFGNIEATALIQALSLEGIAVSAGSACASHKDSYSYVLKSMGKTKMAALSTVRISLGKGITEEKLDYAANRIIYWVKRLRSFSPEKF